MTEHDHNGEPKVWCTRCHHEHIAAIPATTYMCDSCGFGQWDLGAARVHEAQAEGHRTYPIAHPTVPLEDQPPVPTAAGVLHEVVTRIDEARYVNEARYDEDTASPWANTDVLELLAHLRQPYTEGGVTEALTPSSQPTPSAEPVHRVSIYPVSEYLDDERLTIAAECSSCGRMGTWPDTAEGNDQARSFAKVHNTLAATPPRIEDMAPGLSAAIDRADLVAGGFVQHNWASSTSVHDWYRDEIRKLATAARDSTLPARVNR